MRIVRIQTMLGDVMKSLFQKPATEQYPFVKKDTPSRLRGQLSYNPDKCTGCSLCAKECPSNAIEMITIDKAAKRFVMRYYVDRCTFCAQCVQNCRFDCIELSSTTWEMAATDKEGFTKYYGKEENVSAALEGNTQTDAKKSTEG